MVGLSVLTLYFISFFHRLSAGDASAAYTPTDEILVVAGSSGNPTAKNGRQWTGDIGSKFATFPQSNGATVTASSKSKYGAPYSTVRISRTNFTYNFSVNAGPKFVRLYFYPTLYSEFKDSAAFFSVNSDSYTLLRNFSAYLNAAASSSFSSSTNPKTLMKEFCLNVEEENRFLHLTFTSFPTPSNDSYAFVNGIEVFSMPPYLYYTPPTGTEPRYVGQSTNYQIENSTALETMYRINVVGSTIDATADSGLFRLWSKDDDYFQNGQVGVPSPIPEAVHINHSPATPPYFAPDEIYQSYRSMGRNALSNKMNNLTWVFPVDLGFKYLVRLHFCETDREIVGPSYRMFMVYIDNQEVENQLDVFGSSGGLKIPIYRDYVLDVGSRGSKGKYNLSIELGARATLSQYPDAFLNGVEILQLSDTVRSLSGVNPELLDHTNKPSHSANQAKPSSNKKTMLIAVAVAVTVGLLFALLLLFILFRLRRRTKCYSSYSRKSRRFWCWGRSKLKTSRTKGSSSLPEELCLEFSLDEIVIYLYKIYK